MSESWYEALKWRCPPPNKKVLRLRSGGISSHPVAILDYLRITLRQIYRVRRVPIGQDLLLVRVHEDQLLHQHVQSSHPGQLGDEDVLTDRVGQGLKRRK